MTIRRAFEWFSLLAWAAMVAVYVAGLAMVPTVPHLADRSDLQPGRCYNLLSKIGTPLFHCSETGFDGPAQALLTAAWLWVHPIVLLAVALFEGAYFLTAVAWSLATAGVFSFVARQIAGWRGRR